MNRTRVQGNRYQKFGNKSTKKEKKRGKIMSSSVATDRIDFAETIL